MDLLFHHWSVIKQIKVTYQLSLFEEKKKEKLQ